MADVAVIGAGAGGLAAAIGAAARGLRVEVVEAGPRPGGKLGIEVLDGVEVDTGPSVLTLPNVLDELFRLGGSSLADELTLRRLDPGFRYLYPDGVVLDIYHEPEATLESVRAALGGRAADDLAAFLRYAGRIWDASAPAFVLGPAPTPATVARGGLARLASLARIDPLRSMNGAIRARVRSPHLRTLLARYATYNGSDPRRAPATLNCIAHVELALGGFGVQGGMYEIVRALVRVAERMGVIFRYGTAATAIRMRGGRVQAVELADGGVLAARAVVGNAEAAQVLGALLPPELRREPGAEPSMSGWVGLVRARRQAGRVPHAVVFPDDYGEEFADIFDRRRPPSEPTVYACAQEGAHGRAGWPDGEPLFLMANAPARRDDAGWRPDPERWDRLRERVLHRAREAGVVHSGDSLVYERTPAQLARQFPGSGGSIYGSSSNSPWSAFRRPANRVRGVGGLYLASGSAHPGGGVPLCLLSGRAAVAALTEDLA